MAASLSESLSWKWMFHCSRDSSVVSNLTLMSGSHILDFSLMATALVYTPLPPSRDTHTFLYHKVLLLILT